MKSSTAAYAEALLLTLEGKGAATLPTIATRFTRLIRRRGDGRYLKDVLDKAEALALSGEGFSRVEVTKAATDASFSLAAIEKVLGKKILFTERVKPAILGGVIVTINGDTVLDGSIRRRLTALKNI